VKRVKIGKNELEAMFNSSRENMEWFKENYDDLERKYDNRWIIMQNKKVVESASTFDEIMSAIKKYDRRTIIVEYIQSKPIAMFF